MLQRALQLVARIVPGDGSNGERRTWTLVAAGTFGTAGFLAAVVVTLLSKQGKYEPLPIELTPLASPTEFAVWILAPALGAVVTVTPAWYVLVERLAGRWKTSGRPWLRPPLGGAAGAISGVLAHGAMWVIVAVILSLPGVGLESGGGIGASNVTASAVELVTRYLVVIGVGSYLGVLLTGWITVPGLAVVGLLLGIARDRIDLPGAGRSGSARTFGERAD